MNEKSGGPILQRRLKSTEAGARRPKPERVEPGPVIQYPVWVPAIGFIGSIGFLFLRTLGLMEKS